MILSHFNHYSSSALTSTPNAHETRAIMRGSEKLYPLPGGGPGLGALSLESAAEQPFEFALRLRIDAGSNPCSSDRREPKFTGEAEHVLGRVRGDLHQGVLAHAVRVFDQ
jgi:hypothetical protein